MQRPGHEAGAESHAVGVDPRWLWILALAYLVLPASFVFHQLTQPTGTPVGVVLALVPLAIFAGLDLSMLARPVDVLTSPHGLATIDALGRRRDVSWKDLVELRMGSPPSTNIEVRGRDGQRLQIARALVGRSLRRVPDMERLVKTIRVMAPDARVVLDRTR